MASADFICNPANTRCNGRSPATDRRSETQSNRKIGHEYPQRVTTPSRKVRLDPNFAITCARAASVDVLLLLPSSPSCPAAALRRSVCNNENMAAVSEPSTSMVLLPLSNSLSRIAAACSAPTDLWPAGPFHVRGVIVAACVAAAAFAAATAAASGSSNGPASTSIDAALPPPPPPCRSSVSTSSSSQSPSESSMLIPLVAEATAAEPPRPLSLLLPGDESVSISWSRASPTLIPIRLTIVTLRNNCPAFLGTTPLNACGASRAAWSNLPRARPTSFVGTPNPIAISISMGIRVLCMTHATRASLPDRAMIIGSSFEADAWMCFPTTEIPWLFGSLKINLVTREVASRVAGSFNGDAAKKCISPSSSTVVNCMHCEGSRSGIKMPPPTGSFALGLRWHAVGKYCSKSM